MSTTTSILNDLIETLKDGQEGFRAAAADVKSPDLKTLFGELSLQRSKFAGELQALAHEHGEKNPADSGSTAGAIHRGWIDLKAGLVKQDNHAILSECERGEDSAVAAYEKVLKENDLDANVTQTLERQFTAIQDAHDRIKRLRDALAETPSEKSEPTLPSSRDNPGGMVEKAPFGNT